MDILPSLVEGYMYSEMYHLEGGSAEGIVSGGYPVNTLDEMVGGGEKVGSVSLAHYVVPVGLVCDLRVAPLHLNYINTISHEDAGVISDDLHDFLYGRIASKRSSNGSRKKFDHNLPKNKSTKLK